MHKWVSHSASLVLDNLPTDQETCVLVICDEIFGPEWRHWTEEQQQAKRNIIEEEYNRV